MVKVEYSGRLGNNLFQYALGRYLAEEMGYELEAGPLPFTATHEKIKGLSFQCPRQRIGQFHIGISSVINNKTERLVLLDGFFQHYRYYRPFLARIKEWFSYPSDLSLRKDINKDDLLIYVRLGDYSDVGMHLKYTFFDAAIQMARPNRVFIVTEKADHSFLSQFKNYNPVIISQDPLADLAIARSFNKIILSCSTFSWWAALLADPEEVYFPIADAGIWSPQTMHPPNYNQDLRIDDSRYVYFYNCAISSSERNNLGYVSLPDASPELSDLQAFSADAQLFHEKSAAYWFL